MLLFGVAISTANPSEIGASFSNVVVEIPLVQFLLESRKIGERKIGERVVEDSSLTWKLKIDLLLDRTNQHSLCTSIAYFNSH